MDQERIEKLLELLNIERKKEVEKFCRDMTIRSEDFADLIFAARVSALRPYLYDCRFAQYHPDHLHPSQTDLAALARNAPGPLDAAGRKAIGKVFQIYDERRLFSAHLFYTPSHDYWHLFYFDQRDTGDDRNHWKHGPHIHYTRESFTNRSLREIWQGVCSDPPVLPGAVHIRYDYHHNRE